MDFKKLEEATSKVTYELLKGLPVGDSIELGNGYYLMHQEYDYVCLDDDDCEEYQMETNLTCPMCGSLHLVYLPKEETEWVGVVYED